MSTWGGGILESNPGRKRKKILLVVIGILLSLGIIISVSYAWWSHIVSQEGINTIESTCLEIELTDENPIHLQNAYPITDAEAKILIPYTFTITNTCNTAVEYDVNLDIMESTSRLSSEYIAVEFNGETKKLLNTLENVEPSYPGSDYIPVEARYLTSGELGANESKTYTIKLWMDESVTVEDDAMNKNFISKIVVTAKQSHKVRLVDLVNLGDYVEMTPTSTSYTISSSMTGYSTNQTINPSELNLWRVIKKNEDGTIEMVSEYVSSTVVYLKGQTGYNNLVLTLQTIASQYANDAYTISTRHVGYNGQIYVVPTPSAVVCGGGSSWWTSMNPNLERYGCGDISSLQDQNKIQSTLGALTSRVVGTSNAGDYWLVERNVYVSSNQYTCFGLWIKEDGSYATASWNNKGWLYGTHSQAKPTTQSLGHRIRPIVTLNKETSFNTGNGTKESPYLLVP